MQFKPKDILVVAAMIAFFSVLFVALYVLMMIDLSFASIMSAGSSILALLWWFLIACASNRCALTMASEIVIIVILLTFGVDKYLQNGAFWMLMTSVCLLNLLVLRWRPRQQHILRYVNWGALGIFVVIMIHLGQRPYNYFSEYDMEHLDDYSLVFTPSLVCVFLNIAIVWLHMRQPRRKRKNDALLAQN